MRCTPQFVLSAARTPKFRSAPGETDPFIAAIAIASSVTAVLVAGRLTDTRLHEIEVE